MRTTPDRPRDTSATLGRSFDVVPIAMPSYRDKTWKPLPKADDEARAIGEVLEKLGGVYHPWDVDAEDRDLTRTMHRLQHWAAPAEPRNSVLLWLGHGRSNNTEAYLIVQGTAGEAQDIPFGPDMLVKQIADEHSRRRNLSNWSIVVIEACGAARFVQHVGSELLKRRALDGVLVIGCGADQGPGYLGTFRRALAKVCPRYTSNDAVITLHDFGKDIEKQLPSAYVFTGRCYGTEPLLDPPRLLEPITTPVDVYVELHQVIAGLPEHEQVHFAPKGTGTDLGEFGWHFVGREMERARLLDWLTTNEHGVLVLTGEAGRGKSAFLGNVLLHARPEIADILSRTGLTDDGWPQATELPPIDTSLLLTGARVYQVAGRLADVAGVELPVDAVSGTQRATTLVETLSSRGGHRITVLADSLDDAQEPMALAALLRDLGALPGIRVIVGTRPSSNGHRAQSENLLDEVGRDLDHVTVQWVHHDAAAIAEYVRRRLTREDTLRHSLGQRFDRAVSAVASLIAAPDPCTEETREFLEARLVVREILADHDLLLPEQHVRLVKLLELDHRALFARAVTRMVQQVPATEPFLRALAFAQGRGLPRRDGLWTIAAQATTTGGSLTEDDLDSVLAVAGPYIMLDAADGQSVYRLAHSSFQEHYRTHEEAAGIHRRIMAALLDAAEEQSDLNPYLRRHLSGHAAACGPDQWQALAERCGLLDRLDIDAVVSDAMHMTGGLRCLPTDVVATFVSAHLAITGNWADRRGLRQLGRARISGVSSASRQSDRADDNAPQAHRVPWDLRWARVRPNPPHLTLIGHVGSVRGITTVAGPDGAMLASGGDDGTIRLWAPARAGLVRSDVIGHHSGAVQALTSYVPLNGIPGLVSVGADDTGRIWNPVESRQTGTLPDHRAGMERVVLAVNLDGTPRVAIGGIDGELNIWDPVSGKAVVRPRNGHVGPVTAVAAFVETDGSLLLAVAGRDRTVRWWDPTGKWLRSPKWSRSPLVMEDHIRIRSMAVLGRAGEPDVLAIGGEDGSIICWDSGTERLIATDGHQGPVTSLFGFSDPTDPTGTLLLASGGEDHTVRIWDPATGRASGPVLIGHSGPVQCVIAFTDAGGVVRLASGSDDGTIRIWDLAAHPAGPPSHGPTVGPVTALATTRGGDGSMLLAVRTREGHTLTFDAATGDCVNEADSMLGSRVATSEPEWSLDDGLARTWSLTDAAGESLRVTRLVDGTVQCHQVGNGRTVDLMIDEHSGPVRAVATLAGPADQTLLATAGHDGVVRIWAATTGQPHGIPLTGHQDWVHAMVGLIDESGRTLLLTGSDDQTIGIWDLSTALCLHAIPLGVRVRSLALVGDDVAVGTDEGVLVLRLRPDGLTGATRKAD